MAADTPSTWHLWAQCGFGTLHTGSPFTPALRALHMGSPFMLVFSVCPPHTRTFPPSSLSKFCSDASGLTSFQTDTLSSLQFLIVGDVDKMAEAKYSHLPPLCFNKELRGSRLFGDVYHWAAGRINFSFLQIIVKHLPCGTGTPAVASTR